MGANTRIEARRASRKTSVLPWTVQGLLAALFLFAGGMKLAMPVAALAEQSPLPGAFLKLIGVCEFLGGLGLILPSLQRIRPILTPIAAARLVVIMVGARLATPMPAFAAIPAVTGVLATVVAIGRWRWAPIGAAPNVALEPGRA